MVKVTLELLGGKVIGLDESFVTDIAYTKDEIDSKLSAVLRFKGTKATKSELPTTGNTRGDVWAVTENNLEFVWLKDSSSGSVSDWEQLGPIHDLSAYYTKEQINTMLGNTTLLATKSVTDLIGLDGTEGKSLKQLITELTARVSTAEGEIDTLQGDTSTLQTQVTELFSRVGDDQYRSPIETTFLADCIYYKKNSDQTFTQLVAGTQEQVEAGTADYYIGQTMRTGVYRRITDDSLSKRMATAEQTVSGLTGRVETVEETVSTMETDVSTAKKQSVDALGRIGDGAYKVPTTTTFQSGVVYAVREEDLTFTQIIDFAVGDNIDDYEASKGKTVYYQSTTQNISERLGTAESSITSIDDRVTTLEGKLVKCTVVTSEELKPTTGNNTGDICIVVTALPDGTEESEKNRKQRVSYTWDGSVWQSLDAYFDASKIIMPDNINLAGDYTQVGNIKLSEGTLQCKGWTVAKMFEKILNKTIKPQVRSVASEQPKVSVSLSNTGDSDRQIEVGDTIDTNTLSITFSQGKYYQPWDGGTQNDGTAPNKYVITDTVGNTTTVNVESSQTTYTATMPKTPTSSGVNDEATISASVFAGYNDGTPGTDNTGATCSDVVRTAGDTATASSTAIKTYRNMFIGSVATDWNVEETVIKSQLKPFKVGAKTIVVKANGTGTNEAPLVTGAVKIIVAIPISTDGYGKTTCGGYEVSSVVLDSASYQVITSKYVLQSETQRVSGKVYGEHRKAYKVWIYKPASIDSGEVHSITIS